MGRACYFWYFQLRCFPSAIQSTAVAMRFSRVSARLASTIHSIYSRRQLGLKAENVAAAFLFLLRARLKSGGVLRALAGLTVRGRAATGLLSWPLSMRAAA